MEELQAPEGSGFADPFHEIDYLRGEVARMTERAALAEGRVEGMKDGIQRLHRIEAAARDFLDNERWEDDRAYDAKTALRDAVEEQPPIPDGMVPVESSNIAEIGYDVFASLLHVRFKTSAALYTYYDVPVDVYRSFMARASKGAYFAKYIKPVYRWSRVQDGVPGIVHEPILPEVHS